jgi:hypothetical protein
VVWSDPTDTLALALRDQTAPSQAAQVWRQSATDLLALFARNRRRLLLVQADVLTRGTPDDLTRLQDRLGLVTPPQPVNQSLPDLPAHLARLMSANLSDLRPIWDELLASSLSTLPQDMTSSDLDPMADLLVQQSAQLTLLQTDLAIATARHQTEADLHRAAITDLTQSLDTATARHQTEADLHRATITDLSQALTNAASDQDHLSALHQTDAKRLGQAELESGLLRDQLVAVSGLLNGAGDAPSPHIQVEAAIANLLSALVTETDLRLKAEARSPA